MSRILTERVGHVLVISLNRPEKKNAADLEWLQGLSLALGELDRDTDLRCGLVLPAGRDFTAGLDLADIAPRIREGRLDYVPDGGCDPWRMGGPECRKPLVVAIDGLCLTLGIEFAAASEVVIATPEARFGQIEVARGILPFGGATIRLPRRIGWSEAMRWMLSADMVTAERALQAGLLSEVVPREQLRERGLEIAQKISAQAPLAVQATLANARRAEENPESARADIPSELSRLMASEDAALAVASFLSGEPASFRGR